MVDHHGDTFLSFLTSVMLLTNNSVGLLTSNSAKSNYNCFVVCDSTQGQTTHTHTHTPLCGSSLTSEKSPEAALTSRYQSNRQRAGIGEG